MKATVIDQRALWHTRAQLSFNLSGNQRVVIPNPIDKRFAFHQGQSFSLVGLARVVEGGDLVQKLEGTGWVLRAHTGQIDFTLCASGGLSYTCLWEDFRLRDTFHFTISYQAITKSLALSVNGRKVAETECRDLSAGQDFVSNAPLSFGSFEGCLSQVSLYDKALSQGEVQALHKWVGLIPSSLHAACTGYWPLDVDLLHRGSDRPLWAFDHSKRFNYAKPAALAAAHGTLENYSLEETGNLGFGKQSVFMDLYQSRGLYRGTGYRVNRSTPGAAIEITCGFDQMQQAGQGSLVLEFDTSKETGPAELLVTTSASNYFGYLQVQSDQISLVTGEVGFDTIIKENPIRGRHTLLIQYPTLSTRKIWYREGPGPFVLVETRTDGLFSNTHTIAPLLGESPGKGLILQRALFSTEALVPEVYEKELFDTQTLISDYRFCEREGKQVFDRVSGVAVPLPSQETGDGAGNGAWREERQGQPALVQTTSFNKESDSQQQLLVPHFDMPIDEKGLTVMLNVYPSAPFDTEDLGILHSNDRQIRLYRENDRQWRFQYDFDKGHSFAFDQEAVYKNLHAFSSWVFVLGEDSRFYFNGTPLGTVTRDGSLTGQAFTGDLQLYGETAPGNFPGGGTYLQGGFHSFALWKRQLSPKEVLQNSRPEFPIGTAKDLVLYYQHQEGSYYEDGSAVKVRNLAPESSFPIGSATRPGDWDAEVWGFPGDYLQEQLQAVKNACERLENLY
ncbi:LamG-like jellyroll fold domain-containing protein [Rapidithrix thailandica]|uniref:LamG-like jellyroll fold domain-containing protein n=1 Tax=Rapidithrix thailandica TaxID=413964 RepID=A0AAW9RVY7_9BACT